jgi:hypothetical protein
VVPDYHAYRMIRADQSLVKGRIEPNRSRRSASQQHKTENEPPRRRQRTLPHS